MEVLIDNRQRRIPISAKKIQKMAEAILNALDCPHGELSILLVDDPQIAELNRAYLDREGPTNVIAFPMRAGPFVNITPHLLGDVVISVETALKEGQEAGISVEKRLSQLLVHGILHLFGYDHEQTPMEALRMEQKSADLLSLLGDTADWTI